SAVAAGLGVAAEAVFGPSPVPQDRPVHRRTRHLPDGGRMVPDARPAHGPVVLPLRARVGVLDAAEDLRGPVRDDVGALDVPALPLRSDHADLLAHSAASGPVLHLRLRSRAVPDDALRRIGSEKAMVNFLFYVFAALVLMSGLFAIARKEP